MTCCESGCFEKRDASRQWVYLCKFHADEYDIYPKNSYSLLAAIECLMYRFRGSGDLDDVEFEKLKRSLRDRIKNWSRGRAIDERYDNCVKELCRIAVECNQP
jgi:hypothetical protein